ncbi:hypothetical protein AFLA_012523 [Aspergillus flavus NRRL3357]|nr:hypothetical protein AFLA_012523 [Aspergillus flavus NRRL3357]
MSPLGKNYLHEKRAVLEEILRQPAVIGQRDQVNDENDGQEIELLDRTLLRLDSLLTTMLALCCPRSVAQPQPSQGDYVNLWTQVYLDLSILYNSSVMFSWKGKRKMSSGRRFRGTIRPHRIIPPSRDHNPLDAAAHPSVITVFPACSVTGSFDSFPNLGGGE